MTPESGCHSFHFIFLTFVAVFSVGAKKKIVIEFVWIQLRVKFAFFFGLHLKNLSRTEKWVAAFQIRPVQEQRRIQKKIPIDLHCGLAYFLQRRKCATCAVLPGLV